MEQKKGVTVLHTSGHDFLDQTPVFDIKPYISYVDKVDNAKGNWTENETANISVVFTEQAEEKLKEKLV